MEDRTKEKLIMSLEDEFARTSRAAVLAPVMAMGQVASASLRALEQTAAEMRLAFQPFRDLQSQFVEIARVAVQPFTAIVQAAEQVRAVTVAAMEPFQKVREAFSLIPPEQLEALRLRFLLLDEELRIAMERDDVSGPAFKLFAKLGFTGLESYMSLRELEYVLKISKTKGKRAVQQYVFRIFRNRRHRLLTQMVRSWWTVPYMRKRKPIIRRAITAHKKKNYDLAIPALLPFIDGLAAQIVGPTASRNPIHAKKAAELYHAQEAEVWSECVEQVVCALIYKSYDFQKTKRPPSSVNRHGILHGRTVGYGTELNSYRVILLLNVMVKMAGQTKKPSASAAKTP